jgi:hypothetical protein
MRNEFLYFTGYKNNESKPKYKKGIFPFILLWTNLNTASEGDNSCRLFIADLFIYYSLNYENNIFHYDRAIRNERRPRK